MQHLYIPNHASLFFLSMSSWYIALHSIPFLSVFSGAIIIAAFQILYTYLTHLYICNMEQSLKLEFAWDPSAELATGNLSSTPATERRHSSSASNSTLSTNDSNNSSASRGRRPRPSVVSLSSQLPTVQEKNLQRTRSEEQSPGLSQLSSEETVVSSQKVNTRDVISFWRLIRVRCTGPNELQQSGNSKCGKRRSQAPAA